MPGEPSGPYQQAPRAGKHSFARAIVGGVGVLALGSFIVRLFGLVSSRILTRLVGPSAYGVVALVTTVVALATTLGMMGVDLSYARFFFDGAQTRAHVVERFCWRFALALGTLASLAAGVVWWFATAAHPAYRGFSVLVTLSTFIAVATGMSTTRRRILGAFVRIAVATLIGGVLGITSSIFLAWWWRPDAWAMVGGNLVGAGATLALLGIPRWGTFRQSSGLTLGEKKAILNMGLASTVTAPMFWIINSADRWFLGAWAGTTLTGIYSFAYGVSFSGLLINNAITVAWFPEISREFEHSRHSAPASIGRLWARLAGLHMVTWIAITAAGGDIIRLLADPRFHSGAPLVPYLAGGVFFYGVAALANTGLVLQKDLAPTAKWWTVGAAANLAGNALLVGHLGTLGAAFASTGSFAIIAVGMTWSAQSRLYLPIPWGRLLLAGIVSFAGGILMCKPWNPLPFRSLLLKLPAGFGMVLLLGCLLAPDWLLRLGSVLGKTLLRLTRGTPV